MRHVILLSVTMLLFACCSKKENKYNKAKPANTTTTTSSSSEESKNDALVYDVDGIILKKVGPDIHNDYYFIIELSDKHVFEWEVSLAKFHQKEEGEAVHFDYLAKARFSNKAID